MRASLRSPMLAFAAAALSLAVSAPGASGSVTVGQVAPGAIGSCSVSFEWVQISSPDNAYVIPATGTITSWTHRSQAGAGQMLTLKIYRKLGDPATFQAVGRDGPYPMPATTTKSFPSSVAVRAGDVLGLTGAGGAASIGCDFSGQGSVGFLMGNMLDGQYGPFSPINSERLNVSAVLEPSNSFTTGAVSRNKKRGTATLAVTVPNPGQLVASGNGVTASGGAAASKQVAAGAVKLLIKAKGKKRKALNKTGKVKLGVTLTYTPTAGVSMSKTLKLKLKRN